MIVEGLHTEEQLNSTPDMPSIKTRTNGYYLVGPSSTKSPLLVGFHGYAQMASDNMKILEQIAKNREMTRCAIQALNLFYTRKNDVVANWMTKFNRLEAIEDNISYVAEVISQLKRDFKLDNRIIYFGFSQGGPMAYRAALFAPHSCDGLIILGGDLPPELAKVDLSKLPPVLLCRGNNDQIIPKEQLEKDKAILEQKNVKCEVFEFDAEHHIDEQSGKLFFEKSAEFIDSVLN